MSWVQFLLPYQQPYWFHQSDLKRLICLKELKFEYRVNEAINGNLVNCALDTGSEVTVLTENNLNNLGIELGERSRIIVEVNYSQ